MLALGSSCVLKVGGDMGLFSKTATTDDVYAVIIAVQRSCLGEPGAQEAADRSLKTLRGRKDHLSAVAVVLAEIGGLLKQFTEEHPDVRADLESMVMEKIDSMARKKNDVAGCAVIELGRVFFLDGSPEAIIELFGRQGSDPALTDRERVENMMDLVTVAGDIAAATNMGFSS